MAIGKVVVSGFWGLCFKKCSQLLQTLLKDAYKLQNNIKRVYFSVISHREVKVHRIMVKV